MKTLEIPQARNNHSDRTNRYDRLSLEDRDSHYGALGGGNPPSPSSKSSLSKNIPALIDEGRNSNVKEVYLILETEKNLKLKNPGNKDQWKGQMPRVKIQTLQKTSH